MKLIDAILDWMRGTKRCSGDLANALLQVFADAGAQLHSDFQMTEISAEWTKKTVNRPSFRQHMFITSEALGGKLEGLLTNLYRQAPQADHNSKVFYAPTEPSAPIAMIHNKGRGVLMVTVLVEKK